MSIEDYTSLSHLSPALSNERLSEALSEWYEETVRFSHWQYVGEAGKGDSYLSEVIHIRIYGKKQNGAFKFVQVFLKHIPKNTVRRLTFRSDAFFRNEINFYEIVLPALLNFQKSKNLKDPFNNYVKLFLSYCDGKNDVICLEDAGLQQYRNFTRQKGVDYIHCKAIFNCLAKFHALSFAMKDQMPLEYQRISNAIFETYYDYEFWDWHRRFWKRTASIAIDAVVKEYPNSIYLDKIKEFVIPERYEDMIKAVRGGKTAVISHGDCWTSNFLYKYRNGTPVDVKLIDFQLSRCASPILDVTFFIYACTSQELRLKHYDDLLNYYYEILSMQIKEMGSDPNKVYSWDTFKEEIKKYSFFGLASSIESIPFTVLNPEDAFDMDIKGDEILNIDDVWQLELFRTKEDRLRVADNVVHCVDNGYI